MSLDLTADELYSLILRYATLPVLALVLFICWTVTNMLLSPKRQQERRNREIRKAIAARQARLQQAQAEAQDAEARDDRD